MFSADLSWTEDNFETVRDRKQRKERESKQTPSSSDTSSVGSRRSLSRQWKVNLPFNKPGGTLLEQDNTTWDNVADYIEALPAQQQITSTNSKGTGARRDGATVRSPYKAVPSPNWEPKSKKFNIQSLNIDDLSLGLVRSGSLALPELSPTSTAFDTDISSGSSIKQTEPFEHGIRVKKSVTITVEDSSPENFKLDRWQLERRTLPNDQAPADQASPCHSSKTSRLSPWQAPTDWSINKYNPDSPTTLSDSSRTTSPPSTAATRTATDIIQPEQFSRESNATTRHFQRLIKRLETAKPSAILDRLEEDWDDTEDPTTVQDLQIEKFICALIALENNNVRSPLGKPERKNSQGVQDARNVTNLMFHTSIADAYRLAHSSPGSITTYISTMPPSSYAKSHILPLSTHHITLHPDLSNLGTISFPLPLPASSVTKIFSSDLPALLPSPTIRSFFHECWRLLENGGSLELRLTNALPQRATMGPKLASWLEDHLMVQLETEYRCSRPCEVFPNWVSAAGFTTADGSRSSSIRTHKFHAIAADYADLSVQLGAAAFREIWKDIWGRYIKYEDNQKPDYWWNVEEIVEECHEMQTMWHVAEFTVIKTV